VIQIIKDERKPNSLINEKSPYLLQHAYNPVNWHPWGTEAFEKARAENKPVFLSIGYSTCHWCHVMERESFEDPEVADILNRSFVSVKVDREERPDIDSIYMTYCQAMTGSGGWPLSIFMTPEKKPFFSGSYFPKERMLGSPGLLDILLEIEKLWKTDRMRLEEASSQLHIEMSKLKQGGKQGEVKDDAVRSAFRMLRDHYESNFGGFSERPKFPSPHNLLFLMRYFHRTGNAEALEMVENTILSMYRGGIFDHIGFGFSRYSTDPMWLVPHFEKMLYDNALLAIVYTEAFQLTGRQLYREIAEKVLEYALRDMKGDDGGFCSAEDADSEGEEGRFYIWTREEISAILGDEDAGIFSEHYGITPAGNFNGGNIPNLLKADLEGAGSDPKVKVRLEEMRQKLFEAREKRVRPFRDDKVLTAWNGLMIAALFYAGRVFGKSKYSEAAEETVLFLGSRLKRTDGRLLARYRDGEASNPGLLDDYAFLVWGMLEAYAATFKASYLEEAVRMTDAMIELFWDDADGGFFLVGRDGETLILRPKEFYDGALPSGNSAAAMNMARLDWLTGSGRYKGYIGRLFGAASGIMNKSPFACTHLMSAYMVHSNAPLEITIAGRRGELAAEEMIRVCSGSYQPFASVVFNDGSSEVKALVPRTEGQVTAEGTAAAYVCRNFSCSPPAGNPEELRELIAQQDK